MTSSTTPEAILVKKLFYYETGANWHITDNENKAKQGQNYRLASLSDVEDAGSVGLDWRDCFIEIVEGQYVWWESSVESVWSDINTYDCGYLKIG